MYYAHTNQFCVVQEKYKVRGLTSTDQACEVCALMTNDGDIRRLKSGPWAI